MKAFEEMKVWLGNTMKFSTIISRTVFAVTLAFASTFVAVAPAQAAEPPGTAWMQIVMKKGTSDFAKSFTADASLQTSALSPQQGCSRPDTHWGVLCRDEYDVRTLHVHCGNG